jgi:DNA repair exonuclease SbcCD nuclease subunit
VKVVCSSDGHGDHVSHGVRRFDEVARAARYSVEYALRERAGLYVCCGDLCDPDSGAGTIRAIGLAIECAMALSANGIHSAWVMGNHDCFEDGTGGSTLSPLVSLGLDEVMVFERPHARVVENRGSGPFAVLGLPYPPITSPYDPGELDFEKMLDGHQPGAPIIVASHLTSLPGVPRGEESGEMARGRDVAYPAAKVNALAGLSSAAPNRVLALQGHIHKRMSVELGAVSLEIPGSLCRLTFGEEGHTPRFLVAEI